MPASRKRTNSAMQDTSRQPSPELGDDKSFVKRNSKTGKPVRRNAGKRTSLSAGYVYSDAAITKDEDDSESDAFEDHGEEVRVARKKRRYSPPPPELPSEPEVSDEQEERQAPAPVSIITPSNELALTFNVPPGHQGAFVVKLDLGSLLGSSVGSFSFGEHALRTPSLTPTISASTGSLPERKVSKAKARKSSRVTRQDPVGFMDLPAELRNVMYRHALISSDPVDFRRHKGFSHSGGLLSTCKQIYFESKQILYGENEFRFARDNRDRGNYFSQWFEVGWRDIRRFLTNIGGENISLIKKLSITFEDPTGKDERHNYFTNDDHLMECLKLLATYGQLQTLELAFHGRCMVKRHDTRFLENLKALKADDCKIVGDPGARHRGYYGPWYGAHKIANIATDLDKEVIAKIQRKVKIFGGVV